MILVVGLDIVNSKLKETKNTLDESGNRRRDECPRVLG